MTRRLLFVDDEPRILDGLKRMLRPHRQEWEMEFACGGREALLLLGANHYDVVITDMRMPDLDGAAVLGEVARCSPETVRIILSGFTDTEAAIRSLPVAHQFLMKPCDPAVLKQVIDTSCGLRELLNTVELRQLVGAVGALPPVPAIFVKLGQVLSRPEVATREVAAIVEQDAALTAKVLQLVNSSFFGQRREVLSVQHAVTLLGTAMVRNLTLVREVFRPPEGLRAEHLDLEAEQAHAHAVTGIVKQLQLPGLDDVAEHQSGSTRAKRQVMLSTPPLRFAAWIIRSQAVSRSTSSERMYDSPASSTMPDSPSEHMRNTSPTRWGSANRSTCTDSFMPSARTITFLCGNLPASSVESRFILM